jgi:ParB family chromosome partitioning protein
MPKNQALAGITLTGHKDIFKPTAKPLVAAEGETVVEISLAELHPPEFHPFHVLDDESMERLVKNIKKYGVREPGLARPRTDNDGNPDGYELLCGNRRKRACEIAEISTLPVIIRELDDDSAAIAMVDSNLEQREKLLPSEKAWAYQVKLEALNHQGVKSDVPRQLSVEILCEQTGESKNQIFRLIRLTKLTAPLLDKVDARQLAFNPAVELSYLSQKEQTTVATAMENNDTKPSLSQSKRLKELSQAEELTAEIIDEILSETKKPPKGEPTGSARFRQYFPPDYSQKQMDDVITTLLKGWRKKQGEGGKRKIQARVGGGEKKGYTLTEL